MKVTANFDASEFDAAGIPWPEDKAENRRQLAALDQALRDVARVPGIITSAFRTPQHNTEVEGSETSQHMRAEANDIVFFLIGIRALADRVLAAVKAGTFPAFGQIIFYPDRGHVHISLPTLGERNGEIRYSRVVGGIRAYPLLTSASSLPVFSDRQRAAGGISAGILAIGLAFLFFAVSPARI